MTQTVKQVPADDGSLDSAAARFLDQLEAHFHGDQPPDLADPRKPAGTKGREGR